MVSLLSRWPPSVVLKIEFITSLFACSFIVVLL